MKVLPKQIKLNWKEQFRIVPSKYPPINFFEKIIDASRMDAIFYLESLTNDRLLEEIGVISMVSPEDRICGPGSSIVMAAFTHIGKPSRFTDGSFGIYYAANELNTALRESIHGRECFLKQTAEKACSIDMRVYIGKILKPMHDVRNADKIKKSFNESFNGSFVYSDLYNLKDYKISQTFGRYLRSQNSWGLVYDSVRDPEGQCVAAFRPKSVSIPIPSKHFSYEWNGEKIVHVFEKSLVI